MKATRLDGYDKLSEADTPQICYWKGEDGWYLYLPKCGIGALRNHQITEHEDGTITAHPSIKVWGHNEGTQTIRHGFLVRGEWQPCGDDQP